VGLAAIAASIDQLAADVRAHSGRPEHTRQVAEIWLMVASLDSELARCIGRYQAVPGATTDGTADGGSLP
jgi:hypothetical protein